MNSCVACLRQQESGSSVRVNMLTAFTAASIPLNDLYGAFPSMSLDETPEIP